MKFVFGNPEYTLDDVKHLKWVDSNGNELGKRNVGTEIAGAGVLVLLGSVVVGLITKAVKGQNNGYGKLVVLAGCLTVAGTVCLRDIINKRAVKPVFKDGMVHSKVNMLAKYKIENYKDSSGNEIEAYPLLVEDKESGYETVVYVDKSVYDNTSIGEEIEIERKL